MSLRNWQPKPQLTATVRLTDLAAKNLSAWLSAQPLPPRNANEALNMALESLQAVPFSDDVVNLRLSFRRLTDELDELRARARAAEITLTQLSEKTDEHAI